MFYSDFVKFFLSFLKKKTVSMIPPQNEDSNNQSRDITVQNELPVPLKEQFLSLDQLYFH